MSCSFGDDETFGNFLGETGGDGGDGLAAGRAAIFAKEIAAGGGEMGVTINKIKNKKGILMTID